MTTPRKPGRPPREGGHRVVIAARFDPDLAARVKAAAAASGESVSRWIERAAQAALQDARQHS